MVRLCLSADGVDRSVSAYRPLVRRRPQCAIPLAKAPWTASKIARRLAKWSVYLLVSFVTGGAWILYFADAPGLFHDFFTGHADAIAYSTVAVLTAPPSGWAASCASRSASICAPGRASSRPCSMKNR
jgi:hypothetical protein